MNSSLVFNELLSVLDLVCDQKTPSLDSSHYSFESMIKTELSRLNKYVSIISKEEKRDKKRPPSQKFSNSSGKSNQSINKSKKTTRKTRAVSMEEDSDIDEQGIVRIVIQHKDTPSLNKNLAKTWNNDLPVRLNQDVQRETDVKRMNDLLRELTITRKSSISGAQPQVSGGKSSVDLTDGGLYHRIENKLKAALVGQSGYSVNTTTSSTNAHHSKHSKNR